MSELRVDNIVDMGGSGAPQLRKGASVTGISTITQAVIGNTTINAGGINATGIVTSSSNKFVGDLASGNITAGVMTATSSVVASSVTLNAGGINIGSGIVSATSYQGSGANLTGIGLSIAPLMYTPDVSDGQVTPSAGIGLTFNQRVSAGTGNVTLSLVSVGSTLVENFGVGSSVTYNNDADPPNITITPTSNLSVDTQYAISYPSGAFTQSGAGGSFVGTAYTFSTVPVYNPLFGSGYAWWIGLLENTGPSYYRVSSPTQITTDLNWSSIVSDSNLAGAINSDAELWMWGNNGAGQLGQNNLVNYSSPIQIPGTWLDFGAGSNGSRAINTDGELWAWGYNWNGQLGQNQNAYASYSSPVQVPGTTWRSVSSRNYSSTMATKTDGTLWAWGNNQHGRLGHNNTTQYSSPVQIPGTNWGTEHMTGYNLSTAIKTDGTLWTWGRNEFGAGGVNNLISYSSPTQIPGTTWKSVTVNSFLNNGNSSMFATKTDGTLWSWGSMSYGGLGLNQGDAFLRRSSPVQIPGTNWNYVAGGGPCGAATKTDGTLWSWGYNGLGTLGQNNRTNYSSPVQVPGTWSERPWIHQEPGGTYFLLATKA